MEDQSVFMDKGAVPSQKQLQEALGETAAKWDEVCDEVFRLYPDGKQEWNFPGKKYGWSFRIKDKRRAIIYLLPRHQYFKVAFVFGQKAYDDIQNSEIDERIKKLLAEAKVYAEGRGIGLDIRDFIMKDITRLIEIKLSH